MARPARTLVGLYLEIRVIPVLLWSFTAITLGTALAWNDGADADVLAYLGAVAVGVLLQGIVAHSVNEIADWRSGTDGDPAPRMLSGGSKTIASGHLTERALAIACLVAVAAAAAIGLLLAATHGWWLLAFGATGLAGAVLYTLPPVRLAYRPFAGEAVAFTCVWSCSAGAYALQSGTLTWEACVVGAAHAAGCIGMLMMHHYLDRGPDSRALPPKVTSVVRLGSRAAAYARAWAAAALVGWVVLAAAAEPAFWLASGAGAVALAAHMGVRSEDPASVTRREIVVILAGIAGGLGTAAILAPGLLGALAAAAVLVPVEIAVAGRALAPLQAARLAAAPTALASSSP
jgi:1,4-dihydroxy-2-naphthoate octaprenyltransferase